MVAGLSFQVASLLLFIALSSEYALRVSKARELNSDFAEIRARRRFKLYLGALTLATLCIFVRCAFRVGELSNGFDGSLFTKDQVTFMILEGAMIVLASTALTVFHPGLAFSGRWPDIKVRERDGTSEKN